MTLGEKIKKYRELRELTQRELGQKVGFSAGTEDSRIRKYEKNMMAPQTDIRRKIAEALDIDMSALNDIDIQTEKDAIRALFYLEEKYEMDIKKTDREIRLTFDIDNTDIWKLIEYLEEWATKKEEYIKKKGNTTGEFQWKIYEKYNGIKKLKAGFVNEMEAREYASFLENCNRMAGYNGSRFSIEYGCPVSEAQEEYDISTMVIALIARGVFNHEKVSSCKKFNYAGIMFDDVFYLFCPCIYCTSKKKSS